MENQNAWDDEELDWPESLPFTLAFADGDHENYDAPERYPVEIWRGDKVHRACPRVPHLMRGQTFELEGYRFFTMGGDRSHDIERRINHISWWERELPSDEEYAEAVRNLERCGWTVDHIISHCAPTSIAHMESRHNEADLLTDFLQTVMEKTRYHYWLFGITTTIESSRKSASCSGSRPYRLHKIGQSREKHGSVTVLFCALSVGSGVLRRKGEAYEHSQANRL